MAAFLWENAVADIKRADADIVVLQEANAFGNFLFEKLGGQCYSRGNGFMVISKFRLGDTFRSVKDRNGAVVWTYPSEKFKLAVGSCGLGAQPSLGLLFDERGVDAYAFVDEEEKKRGTELRLLLSNLPRIDKSKRDAAISLGITLHSGSHLDWTERNKEAHNGFVIPFPVSRFLEREGYSDAYRAYYPDEHLFQGFTTKVGGQRKFNNRGHFIYTKGHNLKLLQSKLFSFVPDSLTDAELAVWSQFAIER